jgi:hypothetical protein
MTRNLQNSNQQPKFVIQIPILFSLFSPVFFFLNTDTHTRTITHPYEHTDAHSTIMSISEKLSRLDLEIHEVGHQE